MNLESERTIAVVLGASDFPNYPNFQGPGGPAFAASARAFIDCLEDQYGQEWREERLLCLFDSEDGQDEQVIALGEFLEEHREQAQRLVLYYVGHGGLYGTYDYFLALRKTRVKYERTSGLGAQALSDVIHTNFAGREVFLILDCCFAGRAVEAMMSGEVTDQVKQRTDRAFPAAGTALLCASSKRKAALSSGRDVRTQFSECLTDVLREGVTDAGELLSLRDVGGAVKELVRERFGLEAVDPEVHSARQEGVDVAELSLFPNRAYTAPNLAALRQELAQDLWDEERVHVREGAVRELGRLFEDRDDVLSKVAEEALRERLKVERDRLVYAEIERALGEVETVDTPIDESVAALRRQLLEGGGISVLERLLAEVEVLLTRHPQHADLRVLDGQIKSAISVEHQSKEVGTLEAISEIPAPRESALIKQVSNHPVLVLVIAIAAIATVAVSVANFVGSSWSRLFSAQVAVPNVIGSTQQDARAALSAAGLNVGEWTREAGDDAEGLVTGQTPVPDTLVEEGTRVNLWISTGPPLVTVPELEGLTEAKAREALEDVGLKVGPVEQQYRVGVSRGTVLSQYPTVGNEVPQGATVELIVAVGSVTVPSVVGQDRQSAKKILTDEGLRLGAIYTRRTSEAVAGIVLQQSPIEGEEVPRNKTVNLTLSAPPLANVPNVVGQTKEEATAALSSAGFKVTSGEENDTIPAGVVMRQTPGGGTRLATGEHVRLVLSAGPGRERVLEVQRLLGSLGFEVSVDGEFGERTERAVLAFQADAGLTEDGRMGPELVGALKAAAAKGQLDRTDWAGDEVPPLVRPVPLNPSVRVRALLDLSQGQTKWFKLKEWFSASDIEIHAFEEEYSTEALDAEGAGVLILPLPFREYLDPEKITDLLAWVERGGGLAILGYYLADVHHGSNPSALSTPVGVSFRRTVLLPGSVSTCDRMHVFDSSGRYAVPIPIDTPDHPLLQQVGELSLTSAATLQMEGITPELVVHAPSQALVCEAMLHCGNDKSQCLILDWVATRYEEGAPVLAAFRYGAGRVVVVGTWKLDTTHHGNRLFLRNMVLWLREG